MNTIHAEFDRSVLDASASLLGRSVEPALADRARQLIKVLDGSAPSPDPRGTVYACHEVNMQNSVGGRMGNLLFQYAAALGLAQQHGMGFRHSYHWLYLPFNIPDGITHCPSEASVLTENGLDCAYDTSTERSIAEGGSFAVVGYRQSFKYFLSKQAEAAVREHFEFHSYFQSRAQAVLQHIARTETNPVFVGVHIRAGDLLELSVLGPAAKQLKGSGFFQQAHDFFLARYPTAIFVVRSDSKEYARSVWPFQSSHFALELDAGDSPYQDMATLAACNHTIFTWGSFGWWSSWLAGGTVVYSELMIAAMAVDMQGSFVHDDFIPAGWVGIGPNGTTEAGRPKGVAVEGSTGGGEGSSGGVEGSRGGGVEGSREGGEGSSVQSNPVDTPLPPLSSGPVADPEQGWCALCRAHCHDADSAILQRKNNACPDGSNGPADSRIQRTCQGAFNSLLEDTCAKLCASKGRDSLREVQYCKPFKRQLPKPTHFNGCKAGAAAGTAAAVEYVNAMREEWKPFGASPATQTIMNLTVVTASSSNHFLSLLFFIRQFRLFEPSTRLVIYDIGLTSCQVQHLRGINSPGEIRPFEFGKYPPFYDLEVNAGEYAWKPAIIAEMLVDNEAVLWLDAGNFLFSTLENVRARMHEHGFYSSTSAGTVADWVHPGTKSYLQIGSSLDQKQSCNGAVVGFVKDSPAHEHVMLPWARCALVKECIAPAGSSRSNHRQDQAALTVIVHKSGLGLQCLCDGKTSCFAANEIGPRGFINGVGQWSDHMALTMVSPCADSEDHAPASNGEALDKPTENPTENTTDKPIETPTEKSPGKSTCSNARATEANARILRATGRIERSKQKHQALSQLLVSTARVQKGRKVKEAATAKAKSRDDAKKAEVKVKVEVEVKVEEVDIQEAGERRANAKKAADQEVAVVADAKVVGGSEQATASASCTIVTAYFEGLVNEDAAANMFSSNDALVIFTDPSLVLAVRSMRSHAQNRTHIVPLKLDQTLMATRYSSQFWAHQYAIDPSKPKISSVYWLRNERPNWLQIGVDLNPFKSDFFVFLGVDSAPRLPEGTSLIQAAGLLATKLRGRVLVAEPPVDSVIPAGEFLAGTAAAVTKWNDTYYTLLARRTTNNDIGVETVNFEFTASGTMGILFDQRYPTRVQEAKGQALALGLQAGDTVVAVNGVDVAATVEPRKFRSKLTSRLCILAVRRFTANERFSEDGGKFYA
jgi:hypothetical protein